LIAVGQESLSMVSIEQIENEQAMFAMVVSLCLYLYGSNFYILVHDNFSDAALIVGNTFDALLLQTCAKGPGKIRFCGNRHETYARCGVGTIAE